MGEGGPDEFGQGQQKLGDPNGIAKHVAEVRAKIRSSAFPNLELRITEWSASDPPHDPVHDPYQSAAYILNMLKQTQNVAASVSYWTFSDIFEEAGVPAMPFHEGFGLLNLQGIKKPACFDYEYMQQLGPNELQNAAPASWATTDAAGNVRVLCWNFSAPALGPEADQQYFVRPQPAAAGAPVRPMWQHLRPGTYALTEDRAGYERRDAYAAYLKMGRPAQLDWAQEVQLRAAAQVAPGAPAPCGWCPTAAWRTRWKCAKTTWCCCT